MLYSSVASMKIRVLTTLINNHIDHIDHTGATHSQICQSIETIDHEAASDAIGGRFWQTELCSRFVEPFVSGLFDDPDNNTYIRWTNESTLEVKSMCEFRGRPDVCITKACGVKWSTSVGYGKQNLLHENKIII